ncbi:ImmA/IrrE family metallo-endopeptidase [Agrobacterium larrymoorei]|uniref:ImmA/IrrE family metallo-endopeptidase n=1 Tax=Agrobacterium larrymoorei TaxID=160699 RepID=A0A4D7DQR0_9HYPH|nr:ImmA/IrrE family metallo-endopeptidase [Agrobacterium larrymoorei]QCI96526.1 ImmA/IrrE family metallo-endopeptidase [Agrobacterium larrymoorei]QYA08053.1 ImmA/IrrE family metallo-endopeptidase [Agrobacterium larrymoorei]WHA41158.1 ImmA/IrrE family metallo-endopeptidase [Agrobacterium larrymoorei]
MSTKYIAPEAVGATKNQVEIFAEDVAKHIGFFPGDSLEELVSKTGGQLLFGSSGTGDYESGSIIARDMSDYTIYLSRNTSRQRDRFTIAHELGHLLLHLPKIKQQDADAIMRATRWVDENSEAQKRAEWEANWFAAAFLMPKEPFIRSFNNGGAVTAQHEFDVSAAAVQTRAKSLGLLSHG